MKKYLLVLIMVVSCITCVFAVEVGLETDNSTSLSFAFASKDYLKYENGPVARTSMSFDGDIVLYCDFSIADHYRIRVDGGLAYDWTTQSLVWNNTLLRAYSGIGGAAGISWQFKDWFSLGLRYRCLYCKQELSGNRLLSMDYQLVPKFIPQESEHFSIALITPVTVSVKADTVTLRMGVGAVIGAHVGE